MPKRLLQSIYTDVETQNKIMSMANYIAQESMEKAEEIDVQTESDFVTEKYKHIKNNISSIESHFYKLEKKFIREMDIEISVLKNTAYCKLLSSRYNKVQEVIAISKNRLSKLSLDKKILTSLLIQGIMKILEPEVTLTVRKQDVKVINKILDEAKSFYKSKTGKTVVITVKDDSYLDANTIGGIMITTSKQHIYLDNTLETRLNIVVDQLMPQIRNLLFGPNPNRKFLD